MDDIRTVGLLGAGAIGAGWAARVVLNGFDAVICDQDPDVEYRIAAVIESARFAISRLTLAPLPPPGRWRVVRDVDEAAAAADFLQESLPECEELKIALLAEAERALQPGVVVASSSSGLPPTRLQSGLRSPERFVVGHPLDPVYLMPLVEVCGGARSSVETKEAAAAFYRRLGMQPLIVRHEINGLIADRLMKAVWHEALSLIHADVATAAEIDDAMRFGPGLRWAGMGTFLLRRIAGGKGGMWNLLGRPTPTRNRRRTRLMDVLELNKVLLERIVSQSDALAGDTSIRDLERLRDSCLVGIMQALKGNDTAAGVVLAQYERTLWRTQAREAVTAEVGPGVLRLFSGRVEPGWIDYNGHMNESRYLQVFSQASDALLGLIGADTDYVERGHGYYTVETHIRHLRELTEGAMFDVTAQFLGTDDKRLHIWQTLYRREDDAPAATCEQMLVHVDAKAGRACPALPEIRHRLDPLVAAHAGLPRPQGAGRAIRTISPA